MTACPTLEGKLVHGGTSVVASLCETWRKRAGALAIAGRQVYNGTVRNQQKRAQILNTQTKKMQVDILHGSIWKGLLQFAMPVAATAILGQLFNASDLAVVGNFTGAGRTVAVAAVGANSPVINLVINLFIGIALGANVVIANAIGAGDEETVHKTVHTSVLVSLLGGVLIAVAGELAAAPVLRLLRVPADVFPSALLYLRIYLSGMPVILLYNFEAAIFRSVGETKMPLIALASSGVINVLLNLFFVAVLHMTVDGVAIATVASNAISAILLYRRLRKTDKVIHLEPRALGIDLPCLKRVLRIGLPAGVQSAVFSFSNIIIQSAINSLGTVVMAASSAAYNIEVISYSVLNSFSQACTTFVGQNFGAGDLQRCKKSMKLSLAEGSIALGTVIVLILLFGKPLLAIFNREPEVVETGYIRLSIIMVSHAFSLLYEVMSGYLRGFGISFVPALLTTLGVCGIRIGWIQFVFPQSPTFRTIMIGYPISLAATACLILVALLCYRPARRFRAMEPAGETHSG